MSKRPNLAVLTLLVVTVLTSGCIAAAGAAAGAAGAVAYSDRGARSEVTVPLDDLVRAVEATFSAMDIAITERSRKEDGSETHLKGKNGNMEVNVDINRDQTTKIQVIARRNLVDYDRDYARDVLKKILERN